MPELEPTAVESVTPIQVTSEPSITSPSYTDKQISTPITEKKQAVVVRAGDVIRGLVPTTMQEAWLFCNNMAKSFNLPEAFYKKPKPVEGMEAAQMPHPIDIATARAMQAMQLGMEVGLPPAQAIQSVLVMNGVGTIWGDAQLALVLGSGKAEYVKEYVENDPMIKDGKPNPLYTWVCETLRKGNKEPQYGRFSVADAIAASLWDKSGTWKTHKGRMGKYKARAFCLRDTYADVLKGLTHTREEMEGEVIDVTPAAEYTPQRPADELKEILSKEAANAIK